MSRSPFFSSEAVRGQDMLPTRTLSAWEVVFGLSLALLLLLLLGGELSWWSISYPAPFRSRSTSIVILLFTTALIGFIARPTRDQLPRIFSLTIPILFLSGWLTRPFGLLQAPLIRGEIIFLSCLFFFFWKQRAGLVTFSTLLSISALTYWFFENADGRLLFSDDHPTFLYRLLTLKEQFPFIPFYNPLWNGGIDARDYFATGALNIFLLFSPIIYLSDVQTAYNTILMLLLFGVVPLATFSAARVYRVGRSSACIAALLAVTSSLIWYRWALQFGTLGFLTSTAFLPLVYALSSRFFEKEQVPPFLAVSLIVTTSLSILWTPAGIACIPIIMLGILRARTILRQRLALPSLIILLILHLPWISMFWIASDVGSFLEAETHKTTLNQPEANSKILEVEINEGPKVFKHKPKNLTLKDGLDHLREAVHSANPLLWIFLLPGLFLLPREGKCLLTLAVLWLSLLGSFGPAIKPQLEFDRMFIIGFILSAVPAGVALQHLLHQARTWGSRSVGALSLGLLFAAVISVGGILKGRSVIPITFRTNEANEIAQAIRNHAGDGRALFSGFILHDYSGGHLAPLAVFAEHPIVASNPVHGDWKYRQVFPREYIEKREQGINEYLTLMNASLVFAHEREWRSYFRERKEDFLELPPIGKFALFQWRKSPNSYFLAGSGKIIKQELSSVTFLLESKDVILKFRYFPFLEVEGCSLTPYRISESVEFVRAEDCPVGVPLTLRSIAPWRRWFQSYLGGRK